MEIITAAELMPVLTPLVDGVLEGIGSQAWETLTRLAHARRHKNPQLESAMRTAVERQGDSTAVSALAGTLEALGQADAEFSTQLRAWYFAAVKATPSGINLNINTGEVKGLVQTNTVYGGIHFGEPPAKDSLS